MHNIRLVKWLCAVLIIGIVYFVLITLTDVGIPCIFRLITGLYCPGCGITTMFLRLARLDFIGAFHANAAVLCLSPFWIIYGIVKIFFSPKWTENNSIAEKVLIWSSLILLILFGIMRNIPFFASFFTP